MNAQIIFYKVKKFAIDGNSKNGYLYAAVKAIRVDAYVIVDKTYSLDDWLQEPERSWRKPYETTQVERVSDDYDAAHRAVELAEQFLYACEQYTEQDLTPLFLQQQERETLAINEAAGAQ